jgi:hypothetical protein
MKIHNYQINDRGCTGIGFEAQNQQKEAPYFFWIPGDTPQADQFYRWTGHGWHQLPPDQLPPGKRVALVQFWAKRSQRPVSTPVN